MIVSGKTLILMGIVFLSAVIMLGAHLGIGTSVISGVAVILRVLSAIDKIKTPNRILVRTLSIFGICAVIGFKLLGGNWGDCAVNLLILGCALKFLEFHNRRDAYIQCIAIYFLASVPLIFHYEFYIAVYLILIPVLCVWSFISISLHSTVSADLRLLGKIILPALPLVLILFITFPRIGTIWTLPQSVAQKKAETGVSGEFSPDSVANIAKTDDLAARVIFMGEIPKTRYFQAVVYEHFTGYRWYQSQETRSYIANLRYRYRPQDELRRPIANINGLSYRVMTEATGTAFVPTLRFSSSDDRSIYYLTGGTYTAREPFSTRSAFDFIFVGDNLAEPAPSGNYLRELLFVPLKGNPKTRELVNNLKKSTTSNAELVERLLDVFRDGFVYTLNPGKFSSNSTDELLFTKKAGFCGHYAQALAIMLRMAGIPSRVVGGYLGGKINGEYVILRSYDAHAWTEAYFNGRWQRLDPTALVSSGLSEGTLGAQQGEDNILSVFDIKGIFSTVSEFLDYHWSLWVINFNDSFQKDIFMSKKIGTIVLIILGLIASAIISLKIVNYNNKKPKDIEIILLFKILSKLKCHGIYLKNGECLEAFVNRIPYRELQQKLMEFIKIFTKVHYAKLTLQEKDALIVELKKKKIESIKIIACIKYKK